PWQGCPPSDCDRRASRLSSPREKFRPRPHPPMTALTKYQKLECTGLWRDAPDAQRREVVVNFGEASLTMSDPRSELALSHWSLPAVERMNPGEMPALYAPGPEADETLELDDPDMIAALET